jgi:hypothetical protein
MAIKYNVVQRGNLQKRDEPQKWCTVNYADVLMVLVAFGQTLAADLGENKIVRLGDFGSFRIGAGSKGVEKAEKFRSR